MEEAEVKAGFRQLHIEIEGAGHRRGVEETVKDLRTALEKAEICVHWSDAGPGGPPVCGQRGLCFTWEARDDADVISCQKCLNIWGNTEIE